MPEASSREDSTLKPYEANKQAIDIILCPCHPPHLFTHRTGSRQPCSHPKPPPPTHVWNGHMVQVPRQATGAGSAAQKAGHRAAAVLLRASRERHYNTTQPQPHGPHRWDGTHWTGLREGSFSSPLSANTTNTQRICLLSTRIR